MSTSVPLIRQSALGTRAGNSGRQVFEGPGLRVVEEPFLRVQSLRGSRIKRDNTWPKAALQAVGVEFATAPRQMTGDLARSCARIEPNAWLLIGEVTLDKPAGSGWMLTDVGDRYAAFRLSGARAVDVIASGGNAHGIAAGMGCRLSFAETATVVAQRFAVDHWRLLADVSLARFIADWLADAAATVCERDVERVRRLNP